MGHDAAHDALALAIGAGYPVRLVQTTDQGYERICTGVAYKVADPFNYESMYYYDFNVEWELNALWTERNVVNGARRSGGAFRSGQTSPALRSGAGFAVAITAATFSVPTTMVDATAIGAGGMPNQPDTGPIITLTGPYGGTGGIRCSNYSDRFNAYFIFTQPLLTGQQLVIDCGAWSALLLQGGTTTDVSNLLSVVSTQPYVMAITPAVANNILLQCEGGSPTFNAATSSVGVIWNRYFL